jgi:hypothetical protein
MTKRAATCPPNPVAVGRALDDFGGRWGEQPAVKLDGRVGRQAASLVGSTG